MNLIRNAIGRPGSLNIRDIEWVDKSQKQGRRKVKYRVPVVKHSKGADADRIWNAYFELMFLHFHLLNRRNNHSNALYTNAPECYKYLFDADEETANNNLLELLIGDPRVKCNLKLANNENEKVEVFKLFNYDYLTDKYGREFSEFIRQLDVNVCPYCGRAFTSTVKIKKDGVFRTNQVDHYFPKSEYPWLALSIYNFIPSCASCNHAKLDDLTPFPYPYAESMGDDYRFRTHPVKGLGYLIGANGAEDDFSVALELIDPDRRNDMEFDEYCDRAENEISKLHLNELYSTHNGYICRVFRQRYVFGRPYIEDLLRTFPELFRDLDDVRAMLYLKRIDSAGIGSSPLDKLTRDIDNEIDILTGLVTE